MSAAPDRDAEPPYAETLSTAAARWSVSLDFLRDAIAEGRLPAFRASRKAIRVRLEDVDALFKPMNDAARKIAGGDAA